MERAAAAWIPIDFAIGLIAILLLMLQGLAMWRYKKTEDGVTELVKEMHVIKIALTGFASSVSLTAMGERITAASQARAAEQEALIRTLDRDVDRIKMRLDHK